MAINDLLGALAEERKSNAIIVYFTGDKRPVELFSTQIALDVLDLFEKHLYRLGKLNKISLFLYSSGGSIDAPWPLVSLIREYCKEFEVILPNKALSAATLICLGADKIIMTPYSFLSPIDPQGNFVIGKEQKRIQVEDVTGFINFVKTKIGVTEQQALTEVTKLLSNEIAPSTLGSINRTHSLIRLLADNLLKSHRSKPEDHQIKVIIENLTEKLYSHQHLIGRKEAKMLIGFKKLIDYANNNEEKSIRKIFSHYQSIMKLNGEFRPQDILGTNNEAELTVVRAVIDSPVRTDEFTSVYNLRKIQDPSAPRPFGINVDDKGWIGTDHEITKKAAKKEAKHE
ncbi:hypothetical protein A2Z00_05065 [Candidatus Gottesmanbacteria bacterium RBG_13_45_10]|uniref:Serine protease n=1 Tax=Candidatus Gottesmanbacteria bacterium RBG_13_45_10 TaxID=1798370 RepID=A0A1F5ZGY9_9BACT|nr:MAG: hypothetical protein A2Z00_05065 [Candidatus Gottesmanbacteria bacterium RBG_13_45_10]